MERIRNGRRGYVTLDTLHRENLDRVLAAFNVTCAAPDRLNSAWEKLTPWSDVVTGLNTIKEHHIIAPCSNGSIAMMTRLARFGGLPWDCILGAEIAQAYKPQAEVYHAAAKALRLDPSQVVMVAAHNDDLFAARGAGLRTAFVARQTEYGPSQTTDLAAEAEWDWIVRDFEDLAQQMGLT